MQNCFSFIFKNFNYIFLKSGSRNFCNNRSVLFHFVQENCFLNCYKSKGPIIILSHLFISERKYMDLTNVIKSFEKLTPLHLAEQWDNVGLLVEPSQPRAITTIFVTNDLTEDVLNEAVASGCELIYSYHPPIFESMKSLQIQKWKNRIVIKCIENGIAIYSPHTALDAVNGGVNDWLINCFDIASCVPVKPNCDQDSFLIEFCIPANYDSEVSKILPKNQIDVIRSDEINQLLKIRASKTCLSDVLEYLSKNTREAVTISKCSPVTSSTCGMGRYGKLKNSLKIEEAVNIVKKHLNLSHLRLSLGRGCKLDSLISSVAVCAGSGSSILRGTAADLYITGEMSHHDLLDAAHNGVTVILCEHSNTERGFLHNLVSDLERELKGVKVVAASTDKDPIVIL